MPLNVRTTLLLFYLLFCSIISFSQIDYTQEVYIDDLTLYQDDQGIYIKSENNKNGTVGIHLNGDPKEVEITNGKGYLDMYPDRHGELTFLYDESAGMKLYHISQDPGKPVRIKNIPLWTSLIPPLIAILLALLLKEVIVSLFVGIWAGSFIIGGMKFSSITYWFYSFFNVIQKYIINALNDSGHLSVIVFSLLIGGMVALISKNGGMAGVVNALSRYAKDPVSSQFITWLLGVAIFFDDYANTLIVGNTMRSVTDKYRVSREKLAYIVDSTAAPVAAIAFITTWIGAELGYIGDGIAKIPLVEGQTAYSVFLSSLKYSFYPVFTLVFILFIIRSKKDFGPMLKAERRARSTGQVSSAKTESEDEPDMEDLSPVEGSPEKWYYAVIPVLGVITMTLVGLAYTGFESIYHEIYPEGGGSEGWGHLWTQMTALFPDEDAGGVAKLGKIVGASDSYVALLWASLTGVALSLIMTIGGRVISLFDSMHYLTTGFKTMMPALIILTLAWALAITTEELHTAEFLSHLLQGNVSPYLLSMIIFILSAVIAFSTGSSWSTMAILYPIAIPTTYAVCHAAGLEEAVSTEILLSVISTVLSASVLGDHCSPISDTTILSSLASDCNHLDHVKTQLPYALTVGAVSIAAVFGANILGGGFMTNVLLYVIGFVILYIIANKVGKPVDGFDPS